MGFCLFQHIDDPGDFVAVNAAQVEDVIDMDDDYMISTRIVFYGGKAVIVRGACESVRDILGKGAAIGLHNFDLHTFSGAFVYKAGKVLFKEAADVLFVQEVPPHILPKIKAQDVTTASHMVMEGKRQQLIVERPGVFAARANAKGKVPTLDIRHA